MKILIEHKRDENTCIAHDLGKALSVAVENLQSGGKLLTIDYGGRGYAYSDNDCNFFIAQVSADFSFHKTKASIPQIIAAFAAEA